MADKYTVILGLGVTGVSCIRYLHAKNIPILAMDTRNDPPGLAEIKQQFPDVPIQLGPFSEETLCNAASIIISPALSTDFPALHAAKRAGVPILGDIELFAQAVKAPVVAITGTNAKGTVTTLVGEMACAAGWQVAVGGNIGTAALDLLDGPVPDLYVLELSSFQLETTYSLRPKVATILNVSVDHLDRHGTMENYIQAKQRIYHHCDYAVFNAEDTATRPVLNMPASHMASFTLQQPQQNEWGIREQQGMMWLAHGNEMILPVDKLKIKGRHNWANALAALAITHLLGIKQEQALKALQEFTGLPHRCQWIKEENGITWYDDSKGTNVGATLAALQGLGSAISGKLIWLAGGLGKGADFRPLAPLAEKYVRDAILFGQDADQIDAVLQNKITTHRVRDISEAVAVARQCAQKGDVVLLSPACASWDMFRDYHHRGEVFQALVRGAMS